MLKTVSQLRSNCQGVPYELKVNEHLTPELINHLIINEACGTNFSLDCDREYHSMNICIFGWFLSSSQIA